MIFIKVIAKEDKREMLVNVHSIVLVENLGGNGTKLYLDNNNSLDYRTLETENDFNYIKERLC